MQDGKNTVLIGAVIVLSILGIWGAVLLIQETGFGVRNSYYVFGDFANAAGLREKMKVTLNGTEVGMVEWVEFNDETRRTEAKVRIKKGTSVYRASRFAIKTVGLLGGDTELELIDPPESQREPVREDEEARLIGDAEGGVASILARTDEVLQRVDMLLSDEGLGGDLRLMAATMNSSLTKVDGVVSQMDAMMVENSAYLRATMQNFQLLSGDLRETSLAIHDLAADPANKEQLQAVLANLNAASASLMRTSDVADKLAGDAELQQNIKDTLRLTKETLEETKKTVQQFQGTLGGVDTLMKDAGGAVKGVNDTLGKFSKFTGGGKGDKTGAGKDGACAPKGGGLEATASAHLRGVDQNANGEADRHDRIVLDVNAALGLDGKYVALGVDRIGEGGRINLMLGAGSAVSGGSVRAGVYRGELAVGAAYRGDVGLDLTAYDPQDPKVDATGYIPVGDSVEVLLGVEDAAGEARVTAGAGVRF